MSEAPAAGHRSASLLASLQRSPQLRGQGQRLGCAITSPEGPLERIKRTYNETAFRQAAYEIEQMQAMKLGYPAPTRTLCR